MAQLQRLGLAGMTIILLLGFWAGLWYQGQKGEQILLPATGENGQEEISQADQGDPRPAQGQDIASGSIVGSAIADTFPQVRGENQPVTEAGDDASTEPSLAVHVVGAVETPGLFFLPAGSRIYDAVMKAEPQEDADLTKINLALPLEDGMQVRIPLIGKASAWEGDLVVKASGSSGDTPNGVGTANRDEAGRLNINKATTAELQTLPGIGPAYAQRIIAYREEHGGFRNTDELKKIKGIGTATWNDLKDLVCCF